MQCISSITIPLQTFWALIHVSKCINIGIGFSRKQQSYRCDHVDILSAPVLALLMMQTIISLFPVKTESHDNSNTVISQIEVQYQYLRQCKEETLP